MTKKLVGFFVGDRSSESFEKLCENISHIDVKFYATDKFSAYNIILEDKHLIRRAAEITITEEGAERAALILDRLRAKILQAFDRVGPDQRDTLVAAIESCLYLFA